MRNTLFLMMSTWLLGGCIAPVNLTYESARTLAKGQVDVQGNYGRYYYADKYGGMTNENYGAKIGYGITDDYTLKFRYEHIATPNQQWFMDIFGTTYPVKLEMDYYEVENKIHFSDSWGAVGIPISYYSRLQVFSFDPRYYFTFSNRKNTLEASIIPKVHLLFAKNIAFMPGLSIGFGISSNLDRWAFRPEVGWDGYASYGAALTFNLSPRK
ncbi:MAG: hypothetical protein JNL40_07250 [Cyclobacteriaceae bacterium]|nr:hypothetical protein [Cyclobacteriaceae bacterium]